MAAQRASGSKESSKKDSLVDGLLAGDRRCLARAITAVENETSLASRVLLAIQPHLGRAQVVGFTGAPGVGKSTLLSAFVAELRRRRGQTVGVVAVDPSSPLSGGAILGDRVRMAIHGLDREVFVRSLASRGHLGGLSRTTARVVDVMDAAGKDVVIVETVGTGQSEVEITELAQTRIVVCAPGLGDEIQAFKAGILEIADIFVVNKSDRPHALRTRQELLAMLKLFPREGPKRPVLATVATTGEGIETLADAVTEHARSRSREAPGTCLRRIVAEKAARLAEDRIRSLEDPRLDSVLETLERGEIDFDTAAERALRLSIPPSKDRPT